MYNSRPLGTNKARLCGMLRDGIRTAREGGVFDYGQVLSMPTGSGKTEIAKWMMGSSYLKGHRGTFIVDRIPALEANFAAFQ